ncbi:MAG: helix-turn-helix transcriptional regulator [Burkholderiaceae bacterium]|nr:helix-turn-helix transcriptional regulator [Burkholderiaceae bacterium]
MKILCPSRHRGGSEFDWRSAIDNLGTDGFSAAMVGALNAFADIEHCSAFLLDTDAVKLVASGSIHGPDAAPAMGRLYIAGEYWRHDPTIAWAKDASGKGLGIGLHISPEELPDAQMREILYPEISDRVFLCGLRDGQWYGLSVLRSHARGSFEPRTLQRISAVADPLLSLIAKHARLSIPSEPAPPTPLFRSIPEIEVRLQDVMPNLSRRETQVCARILRGISTPGIALDLELREHSVATYRKRAYRRLSIGTRFELMQLYLGAGVHAQPVHH